jgi:Flp pilus assembly protein TadD
VQNANVGFILFYSRRYDEAIEWCRKTLAMEPEFLRARWVLGLAYEQKRMFDQAIAELERARRISGGGATFVGALGHVYATAGRIAEARRCLEEMQAGSSTRVMTGDQVALIHTGLGDREHACALLEQGADQHSTGVMYLAVDPRFDSLRGDPCFAALLKRLNLKS